MIGYAPSLNDVNNVGVSEQAFYLKFRLYEYSLLFD
jgi:hypothetical protein